MGVFENSIRHQGLSFVAEVLLGLYEPSLVICLTCLARLHGANALIQPGYSGLKWGQDLRLTKTSLVITGHCILGASDLFPEPRRIRIRQGPN